jgi:hypothetical protein
MAGQRFENVSPLHAATTRATSCRILTDKNALVSAAAQCLPTNVTGRIERVFGTIATGAISVFTGILGGAGRARAPRSRLSVLTSSK